MQKRSEEEPLLEFPGGKIEQGETPEEACRREFVEEVGIPLSHYGEFKIMRTSSLLLYTYIAYFEQLSAGCGSWFPVNFSDKSRPYRGKTFKANDELIDDLACFLEKHREGYAWELLCRQLQA